MYKLIIYTRVNSSWYTRLLNNSTQQVFGGSYDDVMHAFIHQRASEYLGTSSVALDNSDITIVKSFSSFQELKEDVVLTKVLNHSTEEPLKYSKLLARSKDIPEIAELYKEVYGI